MDRRDFLISIFKLVELPLTETSASEMCVLTLEKSKFWYWELETLLSKLEHSIELIFSGFLRLTTLVLDPFSQQ
jgi:hypothetical protein